MAIFDLFYYRSSGSSYAILGHKLVVSSSSASGTSEQLTSGAEPHASITDEGQVIEQPEEIQVNICSRYQSLD